MKYAPTVHCAFHQRLVPTCYACVRAVEAAKSVQRVPPPNPAVKPALHKWKSK